MKRKFNKLIAMVTTSIMLLGTSSVVLADGQGHECSYTYVRTEHYGTITAGSHQHVIGYSNGVEVTAPCTILVDRYADISQCGCGATQKRTYSNTIHNTQYP